MSSDGDVGAGQETILVIRRNGGGEEGHHGGAWKIAFADLMTAMMAFFLVMWLLNASDKEKIQQIATYFNPMKLNSKRPTEKGLVQEQDVPKAAQDDLEGLANKQNPTDAENGDIKKKGFNRGGDGEQVEGVDKKSEEELFNDPYGVLARLAQEATKGDEFGGIGRDPGSLDGRDEFRDPFEPKVDRPEAADPFALDSADPQDQTAQEVDDPSQLGTPFAPVPSLETLTSKQREGESVAAPTAPGAAEKSEQEEPAKDAAGLLEEDIEKALGAISPEKRPSIEVEKTNDGLLVSLTDDFRFGMFALASARPSPELVRVMDEVGKLLAARDGGIVIRGHTDARPFRSQRNNNWRLSTDRAQMAYHMLVRSGVDEKRFERIEGYADRKLKVLDDPDAAQNRRIEILLKVPEG